MRSTILIAFVVLLTGGEAGVERKIRCTTGSRSFRIFPAHHLENRGGGVRLFCRFASSGRWHPGACFRAALVVVFGVALEEQPCDVDDRGGLALILGARSGIFGIGCGGARHRLFTFLYRNYSGLLLTWR